MWIYIFISLFPNLIGIFIIINIFTNFKISLINRIP